jgi:uncharacterized membrane protein HdeD (DUF308 family)
MRPARTTKLRIARWGEVPGAVAAAPVPFSASGFGDGKGLEFRWTEGIAIIKPGQRAWRKTMAQSDGLLLTRLGGDARILCKRTWWVFLVGGIASVIFGVLAFSQPMTAWLVVAVFFAAAILVDGASNIVGSIGNRDKDGWWIMLLLGVLGVVAGGYALLNPLVSMKAFILLVAFEAIMAGVFLVMLGYKVRAATAREWILYLTGGLSILFGILVIVNPKVGGLSVIWMIAAWAIITGVLKIMFAFKVKSLPERMENRFV